MPTAAEFGRAFGLIPESHVGGFEIVAYDIERVHKGGAAGRSAELQGAPLGLGDWAAGGGQAVYPASPRGSGGGGGLGGKRERAAAAAQEAAQILGRQAGGRKACTCLACSTDSLTDEFPVLLQFKCQQAARPQLLAALRAHVVQCDGQVLFDEFGVPHALFFGWVNEREETMDTEDAQSGTGSGDEDESRGEFWGGESLASHRGSLPASVSAGEGQTSEDGKGAEYVEQEEQEEQDIVQLYCTGHAVVLRDLPTLDEFCKVHLQGQRMGGKRLGSSAEESRRKMEDLLRFGVYYGRIVRMAKVPVFCDSCGEGIRQGSLVADRFGYAAASAGGGDDDPYGPPPPGSMHLACAVDTEWWSSAGMPADVPTHSASRTFSASARVPEAEESDAHVIQG